jgi:putative membrane protein
MFGCGAGVSGWLLMVGFWVGIVAVVLWAVSRLFPTADRRRDAEDLLDRRLAAGEIDADTYRQTREQLVGGGSDRR